MTTKREIDHLASAALGHLAANPELADAFLGQSGLAADALRKAVNETGFAEAILDFMCAEDARLLEFSQSCGIAAVQIAMARAALDAGAVY